MTGDRDLKSRLVAAGVSLVMLEPNDLPTPDLAEEFQGITFALEKRGPSGERGSIETTVAAMEHMTAVQLARRILEMYEHLLPYRDA